MIQFTIAIKPLSVNQAFQGRKFHTPKGKAFREQCLYLLPKKEMMKGLIKMEIVVGIEKAWLRSDVDNYLKPLIDSIVKKGLIEDDRFIVELNIKKEQSKADFVRIKIDNA